MTQNQAIVDYLKKHKSITTWESIEQIGCTRLSARIADLKELGYKFSKNKKEVTNRNGNKVLVTEYTMTKEGIDLWKKAKK